MASLTGTDLLDAAYENLPVAGLPAAAARALGAGELAASFDPQDMRIIEQHSDDRGDCYLVITGSFATPGNEPHGVYGVFAIASEGRHRELVLRGDATRASVAGARYTHLVHEITDRRAVDLDAQAVESRVRALLREQRKLAA